MEEKIKFASNGHRWTNEEVKSLMIKWENSIDLSEIAKSLGVSRYAILKQVQRLRKAGVPLKKRRRGNYEDRHMQLWSQADVEYLYRRRKDKATTEEIAVEMGRSFNSVQSMIFKLRGEGAKIGMLGRGCRKLYDVGMLMGIDIKKEMAEATA